MLVDVRAGKTAAPKPKESERRPRSITKGGSGPRKPPTPGNDKQRRLTSPAGTRAGGFVLTRQEAAGKWGAATYSLVRT